MSQVYDHPSMQHLTQHPQATHVIAWHTSLNIQAIRHTDGREVLLVKGQEAKHAMPAQAVVALAGMEIDEARFCCRVKWPNIL
jgi:hypothetical protein